MNGFEERDATAQDALIADADQRQNNVGQDGAERAQAVGDIEKRRNYMLGIATSGMFIALMIISAFIKIPIGTIPITLQLMVANVCCLLLGKKWGTISVVLYIVLGLLGLPIFAGGGGFAYFLQPSFGFIIGFAVGGFFAALFREKLGKTNFSAYMSASLLNILIIDIVGLVYGAVIMYGYNHSAMTAWKFLMTFLIPFIPFDIAKGAIGSIVCVKVNKFCKLY